MCAGSARTRTAWRNAASRVTLATGIPESVCKEINLGYRDPMSIDKSEYMDREDEGILYVPKAGEMLYHLKQRPTGRKRCRGDCESRIATPNS
jgi:hypothetical protein